ncbi:hypothetical protein [Aeromicrobium sp. CF3.5]|uniref:hypothetical protein n=1 Tax=Aeromicrobium sp. CF3.5 TaxID=3373078 RepID=UPI003EE6315B
MRAVVTLLAVAALSACSGSADGDSAAPAPSSSSQAIACGLLDSQQREDLTGQRVDTVTDPSRAALGLQCRWADGATFVEVSSLDAGSWASSLPDLINALTDSGRDVDADEQESLQEIVDLVEGRGALSATEACDLFPTIAGAVADDEPSDFVLFVPIQTSAGADAVGVQAQTCTDGVFSSVVFAAPGVAESDEVRDRARTALDQAHRAAIASGALAV